MDVQELATLPIFTVSLVICGLVAAYACATLLASGFGRLTKKAIRSEVNPSELESLDYAALFHNQLEALIERVVAVDGLLAEMPTPPQESSWDRLLRLVDELEIARAHLHSLLDSRQFSEARTTAEFLTGSSPAIPPLGMAQSVDLKNLFRWQHSAKGYLERIVSKIEDEVMKRADRPEYQRLSQEFFETIEELKEALSADSTE